MLDRAHRLRKSQDFGGVYQQGHRYQSSALILRTSQQSQPNQPTRIGISISQKVSKRAVVRNRIKRQLRAIFRQLINQISQGWDVIVVVKPSALECDYQQFLQELKQLLAEAKLFDGH